MGRHKRNENYKANIQRPATTASEREKQLVSIAIDCAEEQIRNGTASAQVLTHFLRLGSTKEKLEQDILQHQKELISAKTDALKSAKKIEELYANALKAMRVYSGGEIEE